MDAMTIESWIKRLGQPYDVLVAEGNIPNQPLEELYPGRDWVDIEPAPGLELSFWAETRNLERVFITFLATMPGVTVYTGKVPKPYTSEMTQSDVRAIFGAPMEFKGPIKMPQPMGQTGGWESYHLDPATYPNVKVVFQYTAAMKVKTLVFSLIDKGHD